MQQVWDNEENFQANLADLQEVNEEIESIKDKIIELKDFIRDPRISGQIRDLELTGERTSDNMVRILAILQNWLNFLY